MKFMHLADLHLGKTLGDFDLIDDQRYILEQILEIAKKESVDAILIAGDVYDKAIPSEAATRLLDEFLKKLVSARIKTYMISGNHDSDDRLNYGSSLFESSEIYISAIYDGKLKEKTISDGETEVCIYMLPFVKASHVRHFYPDEEIENYEDALRLIIEKAEIDENKVNLILAHQFVAGKGEDPVLSGSESAGTQSVGLVEKIGYDVFDKFDYAALGHIHSAQRVGREEVRYSGSPLKYSLSEVNNEKSVPIINIEGKNEISIKLHPLKPLRDMRHIRGSIKDLLDESNVCDRDDFIYATLTDEEIIDDAMGIFQQIYPNTVKIDYDNSHTREAESIDISRITENRTFSELIGDFYKMIYDSDMTDEEMEIMNMAAREAGVINETD